MTARRDGDTAGAAGQLRASRADREQAIEVLKVAFTQERLAMRRDPRHTAEAAPTRSPRARSPRRLVSAVTPG